MTRRSLGLVFVASLITLTAVATSYVIVTQSSDAGDVAAIEASLVEAPAPTAAGSTGTAAAPTATDESPPPSVVPVWSGLLTDLSAADPAVPVALRLNSLDVDAPVVPTGVESGTGQMAVPGNVRDVAWYQFGPRPGERGSAVLAAHVDLASQGPGVFFELRSVEPGATVEIEFSDGSVSFFRVEARTIYEKTELPLETIFAKDGSPVLTLITCGGGFNESSGGYDSNVVVYAIPISERDLGIAG